MSTPVVVVSGAGTSGPRGNSWLSGAGAPSNTMATAIDGDFYLDTTNVGVYYGPRTNGVWGTSHPFTGPLTNFSATTNPGVGNDNTQGYSRGSTWINTTTNSVFVCTANATGAAVWVQTLPVGNPAGGDLSGTLPNPTVARVNGTTVTGTPGAANQLLQATSTGAAAWGVPSWMAGATGVISGGNMTINALNPAAFDIVTTTGYIADYVTNPNVPTVTKVTIPAQTVAITGANAARAVNWWVSDVNGNITSIGSNRPTDSQHRTMIQLGVTGGLTPSGNILSILPAPSYMGQPYNQLLDLMYNLGPFSVSGDVISPNGVNLNFNKAVGNAFFSNFSAATTPNDPHNLTSPAETPCTFRYATQISGSENSALTTLIDPTQYDNGGVITLVGGGTGTSTIQRVWLFGTATAGTQLVVQYGQRTYGSLSAAQAAIGASNYIVNPDFVGVAALIGWIAVTRSASNLSDPTQAIFVLAGKFATP